MHVSTKYLTIIVCDEGLPMVTHINIAVDDDLAERAKQAKNERGWTWGQFIEAATDEFE